MKEKIRKIDRLTIVKSMAFLMVMLLIASLAWHCDDAYHGFVMARNLVNGNGLVYNVGERVNASTCPLFTLLVAGVYAILGGGVNMYLSGILACLICSGAAVWFVFFKCCKNFQSVFCALICLGGARAFITYATSGLENCLLFFLMVLFCYFVMGKEEYGKRDLFFTAFVIGMLMTTRMDNVLLVAPVTAYVFLIEKKKASLS